MILTDIRIGNLVYDTTLHRAITQNPCYVTLKFKAKCLEKGRK